MRLRKIGVIAAASVVITAGAFLTPKLLASEDLRIDAHLGFAVTFFGYAVSVTTWAVLFYLCWFRWWFAMDSNPEDASRGKSSRRIARFLGWIQLVPLVFGCGVLYRESVLHLLDWIR